MDAVTRGEIAPSHVVKLAWKYDHRSCFFTHLLLLHTNFLSRVPSQSRRVGLAFTFTAISTPPPRNIFIMDDSDSDLTSVSSGLSEPDAEMAAKLQADTLVEAKPPPKKKSRKSVADYFKPTPKSERPPTPEPPKRAPSPPHEYVLVDKDAIAFIVMFRSRFSECFAASLPHYGPQDIERGVSSEHPSDDVERLLCALLSLCLNRKKPVERGHYGRALEDAVSEFKTQWPREWEGKNPVSGDKSFNTMNAEERVSCIAV